MYESKSAHLNRRGLVLLAAAAGATLTLPRSLLAASAQSSDRQFGGNLTSVRAAIEKQRPEAIKRLQNWIALPSIAAENRNMKEGVQMMIDLLKEAGFQSAKVMPTDGQPGVFATLDAGAKRTVGMYFMYDVKQFDPTEWSSPPLAAAIVDKPAFGKVMIGRGAANQKGPEATFLAALHALKAAGRKPPVNIVLVAEGEEEIASPHFADRQMMEVLIKTYRFLPAFLVDLVRPRHRQRPCRHILRDARPRAYIPAVFNRHRRHQRGVAAHKNPIANPRCVLLHPVVVARNHPGANVGVGADHRVAQIGQMAGL